MWHIHEHHSISKTIKTSPLQVIKKYELWKGIVFRHGPSKLREFPGFNDEKLKGKIEGYRSSRLNILYRVIYQIENEEISVYVIEITPHKY